MSEAIDFSDIPELGDEFFSNAKMRPALIQKNSVLLDRDVYEWFKSQSPDHVHRINMLLRDYMDQQKS